MYTNDEYNTIIDNLQELETVRKTCRIINEDDFHRASVLIPFFNCNSEWHVVFEKRAGKIRQGGEVSFPGGIVEEHDRTPQAAAVRESSEELGIPESKIVLAGFFGTFIGTMGILIDAYIGRLKIESLQELPFNREEVDDVFSIPFRYFMEIEPQTYNAEMQIRSVSYREDGSERVLFPAKELGLPKRYHSTWDVRPHSIYVYSTKPYTLWGITAKIMLNLAMWLKKI
jgi:8-oxo-dGTP pyrophosphatase MutT (NUDIX family)